MYIACMGQLSRIPLAILYFFPAICTATEVYHCIKPSDANWVNTEPCLTLQQFGDNASLTRNQYSFRNISLTLEFLPGNHSLSSHVFIGEIAHMKIFSQAKNVSITCTDHGCLDSPMFQQ